MNAQDISKTEKLFESSAFSLYIESYKGEGADKLIQLFPNLQTHGTLLTQFLREYDFLQQTSHFHHVMEIEHQTDPTGGYRLSSPIPKGTQALSRWIKQQNITVTLFLEFAPKLVDALLELHNERHIHRFLNPYSIWLHPESLEVHLCQVGAFSLFDLHKHLYDPELLQNHLPFIAPEQTGRMNHTAGPYTDFYSLGLIFYTLLAENPPFLSKDPLELIHCHIAKTPPALHQQQKHIPEGLSLIVQKLLSKAPEKRYHSLHGLKTDLEHAQKQFNSVNDIPPFSLGQQDRSHTLQIPQKLYGRSHEQEALLNTFAHTEQGGSSLALVSGVSGIGKTALVQELYKPVTASKGYFVAGKYELMSRDIPYSAVVQAFQALLRQILTESETRIQHWKEKILRALDLNGQVIIDVLPELEEIIGKQPPIPELDSQESKNRFRSVFQRFVGAFAQLEHPLVLFLDDLQWADPASFELIPLLTDNPDVKSLMVLGAYRDNEVDETHPLREAIKLTEKKQIPTSQILLEPLQTNDILRILQETLHKKPQELKKLSELISKKTEGNPFFIRQFLQTSYEEKLLYLNEQGEWSYDFDEIERSQVTENVLAILTSRIERLTPEAKEALTLASCLGSSFSLELFAHVYQKDPAASYADLYHGIQLNMLEIRKEIFYFAHDKLRETLYGSISPEQKESYHFQIGQALLEQNREAGTDNILFELVNHLNMAPQQLQTSKEKLQLAKLNHQASEKAKRSNAYQAAQRYAIQGCELLPTNPWQTEPQLTFDLYFERASNEYFNRHFEDAEHHFELCVSNAQSTKQKVRIARTKTKLYTHVAKTVEAAQECIHGLKQLGVHIPLKPTPLHIVRELLTIKWRLRGLSPQDILKLPPMKNEEMKWASHLLYDIASAAYCLSHRSPNLFPLTSLTSLSINLRYGMGDAASWGLSAYAFVVSCVMGDHQYGYELAEVALQYNKERGKPEFEGQIMFLFGAFIYHQCHASREFERQHFIQTFQSCTNSGDLLNRAHCSSFLLTHVFFRGFRLEELQRDIKSYGASIVESESPENVDLHTLFFQLHKALTGQTHAPETMGDERFDLKTFETRVKAYDLKVPFSFFHLFEGMLNVFFQKYKKAIEHFEYCEQLTQASVGYLSEKYFYFFQALSYLKVSEQQNFGRRRLYKKRIKRNRKKLQLWAKSSPGGAGHLFHLLEAELAQQSHQWKEASKHYKLAIQQAHESKVVHMEALANELHGQFWSSLEQPSLANQAFQEAKRLYLYWGATSKAEALLQETAVPIALPQSQNQANFSNDALDVSTVIKAFQTISSEIVLERLLQKLVALALENAGAQRGLLLLNRNQQLTIEGEGTVEHADISVLQSVKPTQDNLPMALIHYVQRKGEALTLDYAAHDKRFQHDPYVVKKDLKSVLCIPFYRKSELLGLFYLENNLTTSAFQSERIKILKVLSSQIAISLENAILYSEVQGLNQTLEARIEERTAQLKSAQQELLEKAHKAGMADIATNILHNAGNILNSITVSVGMLQEELGQTKLPSLGKANALLNENKDDLANFLQNDAKGQKMIAFYAILADTLSQEHTEVVHQIDRLAQQVHSMQRLIQAQHRFAEFDFLSRDLVLIELIEDVLAMEEENLKKHNIKLEKEYASNLTAEVHKTKMLYILTNVITNACQAMQNNNGTPKRLKLKAWDEDKQVHISITDTGVGLEKPDLQKIFRQHFREGQQHIGALHSCANYMTEMGGSIQATSDGSGKGTTITLTLPNHSAQQHSLEA